ncbi:ABC transporter permease [Amycolatopsis balhimycina DSM 5908]|uniref:ABC transporter permease n=1 Tax=Amycolatopsis balhimycina DSM 5908 TaxID=1081091 RepID=A0A428WB86_AMYBA|nr:ABC transporter permease [Amycolatopsis balhimycina]RSM40362.1 ABC transporter permease [Amycolatopsis balhimycina DSM 5908]
MKAWAKFLSRRLLLMAASLWFLITVTFLLVTLAPSDPARTIGGPYATNDQIAEISHRLGLDKPLLTRYFDYWSSLFHGSLGNSLFGANPSVRDQIGKYLPSTIELIILSLLVAVVLGLLLGSVSAYFHRRWPDRAASTVAGIFQSMPDFIVAVVLIYFLSYLTGALPGPEGQLSIVTTPPPHRTGMVLLDSLLTGQWDTFHDALMHAILPVLTLGLVIAAVFARISRTALREALESDQTKFARACGLPERQILRYALLTSRTPILTYGAIVFGSLFGGTAIVETIFNWNGLSQWAVQSMERSDYPSAQGFVLLAGVVTLIVYVLLDVFTAIFDPRVRTEQAR